MNPNAEIIGTFGSLFFATMTAYGAVTLKRSWFALGLCCFNTIPIIGESLNYAQDDNLVHLALIIIFLTQVIITLPINIRFDSKNLAAIALSRKIAAAILVANLSRGYLILNEKLDVPEQFGYIHLLVSLIIVYILVRSKIEKDACWR